MFVMHVDQDIELALVQPSFAERYLQLLNENLDYLSEWLAWPPHIEGIGDFESFIQQSLHDYADGKSMTCAIVYQHQVVGNISFNTISHTLSRVEIGYWLAEPYRGKGIVTRAVQFLVNYAFNQLNIDKVQISVATGNTASRNVCERLGFELEGIIRCAENLNDRVVDHAVYGVIKS
ncbi:GNAT family N-acetyltransferase [Vibrio astriarenae]|uniref:GNAT family N-acetyltransferase n=1 Tax=Vibrio astriarenae TaxID=1481923 RepID=A0A7Z2YD50_9VIBR|nr:GNAT family protein [Vibrio astriarenae]QIA63003.1 GNAT family N-acetyltransferase [Vibrio astriarenae]